jgi:hypothetical protein
LEAAGTKAEQLRRAVAAAEARLRALSAEHERCRLEAN